MLNVLPSRANGQGDRFRARASRAPTALTTRAARITPLANFMFAGAVAWSRWKVIHVTNARSLPVWSDTGRGTSLTTHSASMSDGATEWKPASRSGFIGNRLRERLLRNQHSAIQLARLRRAGPYTNRADCQDSLYTTSTDCGAASGSPPLDATYARRIRLLLYRPRLPPLAIRSRRPGA